MSEDDGADGHGDADPRDGRQETPTQRADRNWEELLQELRVTQTGIQVLAGFLLTLPFQSRFAGLSGGPRALYLTVVLLAVVAIVLLVAPVAYHRALFRHHAKAELVRSGDRLARLGLGALGLAVCGVVALVFQVVVSSAAAWVVGLLLLALTVTVWVVLPLRRREALAGPQR